MKRTELAHALRAAGSVLDEREFVVVGSAAMFGSYRDHLVPSDIALSVEADLVAAEDPVGEKATVLDGSLGEYSPFHQTHGFYVDGVTTATALLPKGWQERVVAFAPSDANGVIGWCPHPNDLAASKAVANREKDRVFLRAAARARLIDPIVVGEAVSAIRTDETVLRQVLGFIAGLRVGSPGIMSLQPDVSGLDSEKHPSFDAKAFGFALVDGDVA